MNLFDKFQTDGSSSSRGSNVGDLYKHFAITTCPPASPHC